MNSAERANNFIDRVSKLREFIVNRLLESEIRFSGRVPFDIKIHEDAAVFGVLAISQQEAEEMVDSWLRDHYVF